MKRWLTHTIIFVYLGALTSGIVCHTIQFGTFAHPSMYFLVWDMFCGWSAYSERTHIIGEGESGKFYELAPGPWGEFQPFGDIGRRQYDTLFNVTYRMASNTLKHTKHEPMVRIYCIEENWNKKFNVSDDIWRRRYDEPKKIQKYYHIKSILAPDGTLLASYPTWLSKQFHMSVASNPRLQADRHKNRDFLVVNPRYRAYSRSGRGNSVNPATHSPVGPLMAQ